MSDNYVALLGTKGGPSVRPGSSMPTSNLFVMNGQQIVVDCALGVTRGLVDQGMNLKTCRRSSSATCIRIIIWNLAPSSIQLGVRGWSRWSTSTARPACKTIGMGSQLR